MLLGVTISTGQGDWPDPLTLISGETLLRPENKEKKFDLRKREARMTGAMLQSPALRKLSGTGLFILLRFLQKREWIYNKRRRRVEYLDIEIPFTYEEAVCLGISLSSFHQNMRRLVELGFIDVVHQGGAYGHDYSRYKLSDRWMDYGTDRFRKVIKGRSLQPGLDVKSRKDKLKVTTRNCNLLVTENCKEQDRS